MKVSLIAVVYNCFAKEVSAFNQSYEDLRKTLLDNSTDETIKEENKKFCQDSNIKYFDNGGNVGLAKAYNRAIADLEEGEALAIFDEDTFIPDDFIKEAVKGLEEADIVVPIVKSGDKIISPSSLAGKKVVKYSGKNLTAINSGTVIKKEVFDKIGGYNEDMFLDYIDHEFMERCLKTKVKVKVFSKELNQTFFARENTDKVKALRRFEIFLDDFKVFCKESKGYYKLKTFKMALKNFIKYKSSEFFKARKERLK